MKTIKLYNKTNYRESDLVRLLSICFEHYKRLNPCKFTYVNVSCIYRKIKDGWCGGHAYIDSNNVTLKLPKQILKGSSGYYSIKEIANTFLHELDHCMGLRHGEMQADHKRDMSFLPLEDIQIREYAQPVKKIPTDHSKVDSLLNRKKKWESKIKRGQTAIKKINKQIRYYENKAAARAKEILH